ncbi:MAG TPA: diacylglycerol kinase family protein [Gaiellaceae bacterium]
MTRVGAEAPRDRPRGLGRAAAWVAIIAAAAVVASLILLLVRDWEALLLALLCLVAAGAGGWVALTRHGAVRALAGVFAVVALVGGALALILLDAVDELLFLAIATAVFATAVSIAIRETHAGQRAEAEPQARRSSGRAGRAVLIMNPKSGGGKVERFDLVEEAKRRGIEPVLLSPGDDLSALARDAAASADVIGMAGGDGSQALVADVARQHGVQYVCVPAGTRNHLALDLGLNRDDVVGALDAFTDGVERTIDLAFVNDRIFVNNVSLGVYAEIVQSQAYRDAKLATMQQMLPELLGPRATPFDLRFRGPDGGEQESAQMLLVSNNPYVLDRLVGAGSRPRMDTGELGIVAVQIANAAQAATLVSLEALGQVRRFEGWLEWTVPEFEVDSGDRVAAGIDGEALLLEPPLRFRIAPAALTVRLPPTAVGLSPAALKPALSASTLHDLWDMAVGRR